jgi:hypothetical protein
VPGAYAGNLNWGMEAPTRSANLVALAIDEAEEHGRASLTLDPNDM